MKIFEKQTMAAAVVSSRKEAEKIKDRAKDNIDSMSKSTTQESLKEGVSVRDIGDNKWAVVAKPVEKEKGKGIPYFFEFGRGPVEPIDAEALYFRQEGRFAMKAAATGPNPFFREAIKGATKRTMNSINGGIRHVSDSELE